MYLESLLYFLSILLRPFLKKLVENKICSDLGGEGTSLILKTTTPQLGRVNLHKICIFKKMFFFLFEILKKCRFQRYITLNVKVDS